MKWWSRRKHLRQLVTGSAEPGPDDVPIWTPWTRSGNAGGTSTCDVALQEALTRLRRPVHESCRRDPPRTLKRILGSFTRDPNINLFVVINFGRLDKCHCFVFRCWDGSYFSTKCCIRHLSDRVLDSGVEHSPVHTKNQTRPTGC